MQHIIKSTESKYLLPSLELVQEVFSEWESGRRQGSKTIGGRNQGKKILYA